MPKPSKPPKSLVLVKEKKSPRGLVPSSTYGKFDEPFNAFLDQVAPRDNADAKFALAAASDKRFREFGRIMCEPRYRRYSYAALAKVCDISLPEWADFWRKSQMTRALAIAQDGVVHLASDLVRDARSATINCDRCDGFGWVYVGMEDAPPKLLAKARIEKVGDKQIRACPLCKGTGTVQKVGDEASRKMLLDMTGLGGRGKSGPAVTIMQNFGGASMESAVDRLNRVTFDVSADSTDDAIDATEVEDLQE